jgi:hypothetical protein
MDNHGSALKLEARATRLASPITLALENSLLKTFLPWYQVLRVAVALSIALGQQTKAEPRAQQ